MVPPAPRAQPPGPLHGLAWPGLWGRDPFSLQAGATCPPVAGERLRLRDVGPSPASSPIFTLRSEFPPSRSPARSPLPASGASLGLPGLAGHDLLRQFPPEKPQQPLPEGHLCPEVTRVRGPCQTQILASLQPSCLEAGGSSLLPAQPPHSLLEAAGGGKGPRAWRCLEQEIPGALSGPGGPAPQCFPQFNGQMTLLEKRSLSQPLGGQHRQ